MALQNTVCLETTIKDCSSSIFKDDTIYGTEGNEERHEIARKYLVYKVDLEGTETLLTLLSEPDLLNTTGQSVPDDYVPDQIEFPTSQDGHYRVVGHNIPIWDNSTSYIKETSTGANDESIVYYSVDKKIYKAIADNTNIAPDSGSGPSNWEEITDFESLRNKTSITVWTWDDVVACYIEKSYVEESVGKGKTTLCEDCISFREVERLSLLQLWLNAMYSANNSNRQFIAEKIARFVDKKL